MLRLCATVLALLSSSLAHAGSANVAVAANFTEPAKDIAAAFKAKTGHDIILSFGASGALTAQAQQGAPFHAFLSADDERPKQLANEGLAERHTIFTYAIGRIALWSADPARVRDASTLRGGGFSKLAIANPAAAPYGVAAVETLRALGLAETLQPKLVQGATIAQAFQFVASGNAELGFVALSQIVARSDGSRWIVPQDLYTPIRQDAVLLKTGAANEAARAFLAFLKGPEATSTIERFGYGKGGS